MYACFRERDFGLFYFRGTAGSGNDDGDCIPLSFYYECLSSNLVYFACNTFRFAGDGGYFTANGIGYCRVHNADGNGHRPSDSGRGRRDFLCGNPCMDGGGHHFSMQLFCPHKTMCQEVLKAFVLSIERKPLL